MNLLTKARTRRFDDEAGPALCSCSDSPDLGPMYAAAKESAELGREALAWYKEQAAAQKPLIERASARADAVADTQIAVMNQQKTLADEYDAYRKETFVPVEKKLVSDAMEFNTDEERERLAGQAGADTAQAFGSAREQLARDAGRNGINPADGAFQSGLTMMAGQEALQTSHLKNKTRQDAKTLGRAMMMDAANVGRNLSSQQATSAGLAINAGNAGAQTGTMPITLATNNANLGAAGYGTALQGIGQGANIYGSAVKLEPEDPTGDLLKMGTSAMMMMSDENEKEKVTLASGRKALKAIRKMPSKEWQYRGDSVAADGGQRHVGPMAQDVHKAMGEHAAPGGKLVRPDALQGATLAAVQELDKKVSLLESRIKGNKRARRPAAATV